MMNHARASLRLPALFAVLFASALVPAGAQPVISAVAGLVLYSEGHVLINDAPLLYDPAHFVHLREGQRLHAERGRVELMLVPDVLVRLDTGAEIEMLTAQLTNAHIRLVSGSCTVEVRRRVDSGAVEVELAGAAIRFDGNGLYRLKNRIDSTPAIEVFRGKASVSTGQQRYLLKPERAMRWAESAEPLPIEKLHRSDFALLDEWTRVGDTGQRLSTLGQSDPAVAPVLPTRLRCNAHRDCPVTGLDCVLPRVTNRRSIVAFTGPRSSRLQAR